MPPSDLDRPVIGVDVGGTFTDGVRIAGGSARVEKVPSRPGRPDAAVLELLAALDPEAVARVVHGTTVATNAILERRGARTAFVGSEGLGHVLLLGRGARRDLYALEPRPTPSLVPAELCYEAPERLGADGRAVHELDLAAASALAASIRSADVEAVAICLLFSYLNARHERELAAAMRGAGRGLTVCISSKLLPVFREYERASTTAANAYVAPVVGGYLRRLRRGAAGRPVRVMASHGGSLPVSVAADRAASTVLSGPAAGVLGAFAVARQAGFSRVITLDMGGTSTDVCLCDGDVPFQTESVIDGIPIALPAVAVETVGAGGGSIVRVAAGTLLVGPESAGADPGPASYGRGGLRPTVTDAHVVLGRLPASRPLAGGITLSRGAALAAYQAEAGRYGGSVEAVAAGAVRVANAAMESALRRVSIEQGHDPADFTLVAFGGAGPLHACELAELLGLAAVLVPVWPGAMSALGLACSKAAATASRSLPAWPTRGLERVWRALEASALGQAGLASGDAVRLDRFADMRYRGQSWEVAVPWPRDGDPLEIFSAIHRRRYGYDRPGEPVEVVTLRVRATAADAVRMPAPDHSTRGPPVETLIQSADGPRSAPVLTRFALGSGAEVKGPALIVQDDATTYVASGWIATVLPGLELLLSRPAQDAG